jgi:DNA repair exonuclease SbcCD ATPase subunit
MIIFKQMRWSNVFSYGPNNEIDFSQNKLLQLVGKNGHGKTSLILVLEEGLYNKNSKGIARTKVLNRYSKDKSYSIFIAFDKDGDNYTVETKRTSSTQSVKLTKNGEDISSHTSTGTYKTIEEILGMDHKTFSQIVNQPSSSSLEFLVSTDSTRKKFLIDLLSLDKYTKAADIFKAVVKALETQVTTVNTKITSVNSMIAKNNAISKELMLLKDEPAKQTSWEALPALEYKLTNIAVDNKRIVQNNKYKEILDGLVIEAVGAKPVDNSAELKSRKIETAKASTDAAAFIKKMNTLGTKCPTCLSDIDLEKIKGLVCEHEQLRDEADKLVKQLTTEITSITTATSNWSAKAAAQKQYEEYHALYDPSLATVVTDEVDLVKQISTLKQEMLAYEVSKRSILEHNNKAIAHNARVEIIRQQTLELQQELPALDKESAKLAEDLAKAQVLVKAFGTSGLIAYKIECLVKDLEVLTNECLGTLSGGRFQLGFEVSSGDKLNVVINDNGIDIEMSALSGGEKSRVNISALLGIRKLLQGLSNNRINLLVLDETIDSLDADGKEKLVEILLEEENLNTIIVSHGFQHPLLEKVQIIKTNNISRIDNG